MTCTLVMPRGFPKCLDRRRRCLFARPLPIQLHFEGPLQEATDLMQGCMGKKTGHVRLQLVRLHLVHHANDILKANQILPHYLFDFKPTMNSLT